MSAPATLPFGWRLSRVRGGVMALSGWRTRALGLPLAWKVAGANALIVIAALTTALVRHGSSADDRETLVILALALGVGLVVNLALVLLALRPLHALEATAERVRQGDLGARVAPSPLADRTVRRVGDAINLLLDELVADRARARRLATEVIKTGDRERARLARELHDSTAQTLSAVVMQLAATIRAVESPEAAKRLEMIREAVVDALEEVRLLSHTVHSRVLDDLGLSAGLRHLAREMARGDELTISVDAPPALVDISPSSAAVLYRVAQEGISNAVRHAAAKTIAVRLSLDGAAATLEIEDDGDGFDAAHVGGGLGIFSMRERVTLVDGTFDLVSRPGNGTRIRATVPLEPTESLRGVEP